MKCLKKAKMVDWKQIELIIGHEAEIHIGIDAKSDYDEKVHPGIKRSSDKRVRRGTYRTW